ncbi:unnamed protein product, partial [Vitis vinifera]
MKKKCRTNSQDKSVEKVNMQNNEGEGKASGDIEPEKVAGMEKEGTEKSGEEETDNKTAEINEWANIGKERKETPPLVTRRIIYMKITFSLCDHGKKYEFKYLYFGSDLPTEWRYNLYEDYFFPV